MKRFVLGVLLSTTVFGVVATAHAQNNFIGVSTSPGNPTAYFQDFNTPTLSNVDGSTNPFTSSNDFDNTIVPTIQGFYAVPSVGNLFTSYQADGGSQITPAIYSYGAPSGINQSDRAFGSIASSDTQAIFYGFRFRNTGATAIQSINLAFDFEFWHRAGGIVGTQTIDFAFSTNAFSLTQTGAFTANNSLQFSVTDNGPLTTTDLSSPIQTVTKTATLNFSTPVATGNDIWIRWQDVNDGGTNQNHGFAIDNVSVTFQPVPAPPAAISLGIGALVGLLSTGASRLRRRTKRK